MTPVIYYASDDEFKIEQRRSLALIRNWQLETVKAVGVGKRVNMFKTIEEVVSLKWQLAARGRQKGQVLVVDGIDISIGKAEPFFLQYHRGKTQEQYVSELFDLMPTQMPEWPKVMLKSVVGIGIVGEQMRLFVGLIEGNLFFRPKLLRSVKTPFVLSYVYVMYWQLMLGQVYRMDWDERSQFVTHDHNSLVQALDWIEETLLVRQGARVKTENKIE